MVIKPLLKTLTGFTDSPPPLWIMRQAGRYLPEYRNLRVQQPNFMEFCFTPEMTVEATLQPLRRFPLDGAIVFSDILVIPHVIGQTVTFAKDHGPMLQAIPAGEVLKNAKTETMEKALRPVYEALRQLRQKIPETCTLLGFAATPWTLATYMLEQGKSRTFPNSLKALTNLAKFQETIIEPLITLIAHHLIKQIDHGADVVQLFDTWGSVVPLALRQQIVIEPVRSIIRKVRQSHPGVPIIYYGRQVPECFTNLVQGLSNVALGCDHSLSLAWINENIPSEIVVQGNLDPELLVQGGQALYQQTEKILHALGKRPFVFNLGHGILPPTPIEHVESLCKQVKSWNP